jgi:O-acetyl-ADP-ribose deacetylase
MRLLVKQGDVLDEEADVIVSSANVYLNLSGGVGGAILLRGGSEVQAELHDGLRRQGLKWVPAGSVVVTGPGPLKARALIHAVAIDAFYGTSVALVRTAIENALTRAASLDARSIALPALATGYGRLPMEDYALALSEATGREYPPIEEVRVVLRDEDDVRLVRSVLDRVSASGGG